MTIHSLKDLGAALGMTFAPKERKEKEIKCRVCGAPMKVVPGSNVMKCTGTIIKKDKEGKEYEASCENFFLLRQARDA